ncbi:MAG: ketopantoate reductase family protein, partial [Paracoccaceae bacterium]
NDIGVVDIVLFTVKLADTDAAAARLAPLIGPHTKVVSVQNGIDSADMIARHVDVRAVAGGIIYLAAYIKQPGVITFPGGFEKLLFDGLNGDRVLAEFAAACNSANGISAQTDAQPGRLLWHKFIGLGAFSALTAVTRLPLGILRENSLTSDLYRQLLREGMAVAQARGHTFDEAYFQSMVDIFMNQPASMKSSLLVDIEAKKPTEVAWLSGRMHQVGQELGVATPAHSVIWAALSPHQSGPPTQPEN